LRPGEAKAFLDRLDGVGKGAPRRHRLAHRLFQPGVGEVQQVKRMF